MSWKKAIDLEMKVAEIIAEQESNGIQFDLPRALEFLEDLANRKQELHSRIRPYFSLEIESPYTVPVKKPFLKTGGYTKAVKDWFPKEDEQKQVGGPFTRIVFAEPELGSRSKVIKQLLRHGWKPDVFTDGGQPKLTIKGKPVDSLLKIKAPVGKYLADWYTFSHRESQIKGWVYGNKNNGFISPINKEGRIPAGANSCGTNTGRMKHSTVVNVPKANSDKNHNLIWNVEEQKDVYGTQMRSLFTVREGYKMVGHDASGLELRMLAHYMNNQEFIDALLEGNSDEGTDVHSLNQRLAGLPTRDDAKTFIYAFNYGAGDKKLGSIIGGTSKDGAAMRKRFLANNKDLGKLIERVQKASERGYLIGLDGRKLWMRKNDRGQIATNKALNTLLQGAGAVVMKVSMCYLDKWVKERNLDVKKVLDMHDEAQAEVHPDNVEEYMNLAVQSVRKAGEYLDLRCPLDAEAKVGMNWAETH